MVSVLDSYVGGLPFQQPTSAETCMWETVTSHHDGHREVSRYHAGSESQGTYSTKCE